jgi:hypothetical protein
MSSSDEEAASPQLGAGSAREPVSPMPKDDPALSDDDEVVERRNGGPRKTSGHGNISRRTKRARKQSMTLKRLNI